MEKPEKWTCVVEFIVAKHGTNHRVIGMDTVPELITAVDDCLKSFKNPLHRDVPRGFVKIKSGDPEPEHSGVKTEVIIALEHTVRNTMAPRRKLAAG